VAGPIWVDDDIQFFAYPGWCFPPEIISHPVWLYHNFSLSLRDVKSVLARRGIGITHEDIRNWRLPSAAPGRWMKCN
jgi:transposase-like protein